VSGAPWPPDWPALYLKHRHRMYKIVLVILGKAGLADQAGDAVQEAMLSLIKSPPNDVHDWEAVMVTAAKRKALDLVRSAAVRHAGPALGEEHDRADEGDLADEVAEAVDRQRSASMAWDALAVLDERHRRVAWEYIALGRPRTEVAAELGVTPARVSQMAARALEQMRDAISREEVRM
jgi:RNA polymerase sigma factor (sigma-70 family)